MILLHVNLGYNIVMNKDKLNSVLTVAIDFVINISLSIIIFSFIYFFIAQPHQVDGSSMKNTFYNNDYLVTQKISLYVHGVKRGDVIVFKYPRDPSKDYIKRVIALPGDTIKIKDGDVYLNGALLHEDYAVGETEGKTFLRDDVPYTVPSGQYFVMGDNREASSDSREWGPVPRGYIIGVAAFRYWPLSRVSLVK